MVRRSGAAGALAALVVAGLLWVGPSAGSQSHGKTIRLFERDTSQANLDLGATGPSAGDEFIFAGNVFNHKGGAKLGRAAGTCVTVSSTESLCAVNVSLRGGQLASQGLFDSAKLFGGTRVSFPITGGSGSYRNARGEGTVQVPQNVPNLTDANFVIRLG